MREIYSIIWGFAFATFFLVLFVTKFINKRLRRSDHKLPPGISAVASSHPPIFVEEQVQSTEFSHEILVNLPFKTLVQLSCTSRHMYDRIRSPSLARAQLKKTLKSNDNTNTCLLYSAHLRGAATFFTAIAVDSAGSFSTTALPKQPFYDDSTRRVEIVGHSGGLVCVVAHRFPRGPKLKKFLASSQTWDSEEDNPRVAMWNPTLSRCHFVPTLPWFEIPTENQNLQRLPPVFGFGYNPKIETYEIVRLAQVFNSELKTYATQVHYYTLETNASLSRWQRLPDLVDVLDGYEIAAGFSDARAFSSPFVHNRMHWLMTTEDKDPEEVMVLAYDLGQFFASFTAFVGPNELNHMQYGVHLWGFGESLCLLEAMGSGRVSVWVMESFEGQDFWDVKYVMGGPTKEIEWGFPLFKAEGAWVPTVSVSNKAKCPVVKGGTSFLRSFVLGGGDGVRHCPRVPWPWPMRWPRSSNSVSAA